MSSFQAKNKSGAVMKKPFCKVCYDAGKPEALYTSHYVKASMEPGACIVCPTLLAISCLHCGENGHNVSHCKTKAKQTKIQNNYYRRSAYQEKQPKKDMKKTTCTKKGCFAALIEEDSDEEPEEEEPKKNMEDVDVSFPQLVATSSKRHESNTQSKGISYASMASKEALHLPAPAPRKVVFEEDDEAIKFYKELELYEDDSQWF